MPQKNMFLLMFSCTIIFVTNEGNIGGGSKYFRPSPRGGLGNFICMVREGHIIFNAQLKISTPPPPPTSPLLNSDKSLTVVILDFSYLTGTNLKKFPPLKGTTFNPRSFVYRLGVPPPPLPLLPKPGPREDLSSCKTSYDVLGHLWSSEHFAL